MANDNHLFPVPCYKKVMEDLDFSGLLANCSDKWRTRFNPSMMYAVVTYANMRGVRAVDRIVELCENVNRYTWLDRLWYIDPCVRKAQKRIWRDFGRSNCIATAADIKQNVSINMMLKKMLRKIRSWRLMNNGKP